MVDHAQAVIIGGGVGGTSVACHLTEPPEQAAERTRLEVDVFGAWVGGTVAREPLHDPRGERIRA